MSPTAMFLLVVISVQCGVCASECQDTCKCRQFTEAKVSVISAVCRKEPTGKWATNIKVLKMKTSINEVKSTTLQDATKLQEVDLTFCNITKIMSGALANLTNLSLLRLSHNLIEEINPEIFMKLQNLRHLYLDNNKITMFNAHGTLKILEKLFLQRNCLTHIPQISSNLHYLDVSYNNITSFDTNLLGSLSYLDVCMNPLKEISSNTRAKYIKSLCISGNISKIAKNFNSDFSTLENFTLISFPHVSTLEQNIQDAILRLHNVITLHIANTKLNNLLFLRHMTKMEKLKLQQVNITDLRDGYEILASLICIRTVDLDESPILAHAIIRNFQILLNASCLEILSLRNTNIFHIPCELCKMTRHFKLDLQNNPLECDCRIAEIDASLPMPLQNYILAPQYTKCQSPQQAFGLTIDEYIQNANCSRSALCSTERNLCTVSESFQTTMNNNTSSVENEEDNSIYYIILGIMTGILAIAVIGLSVIYIILKKERRVEPQQEIQEQESQIEQRKSFQQLQKTTSEDTLLND